MEEKPLTAPEIRLKNLKKVKYPELGVCGLSCFLCSGYQSTAKSRCPGCKTEFRLGGPCSILHCALKKGIEFCWDCEEKESCEKWQKHRQFSKSHDTFVCYKALEENIETAEKYGAGELAKRQSKKEEILKKLIAEFNEGRSRSFFCLASVLLNTEDLKAVLADSEKNAKNMDLKQKAKYARAALEKIAQKRNIDLKLRPWK